MNNFFKFINLFESLLKYISLKALGEVEVKKAFPEATIVRPAKIFGPEDQFLNRLAGNLVELYPVINPFTTKSSFFAAGRGYEFLIEHGKAKVYPVHVSVHVTIF